ncbi:hypothetical protein KSP35_03015 [Aquihabitans sp. G128]|uniref:hypothetical protein n=1 Tax=Aquihabitans sp. G128 TaxID=2849779 RepID=UPI001C2264CB|nr:hypothetical protein [Aquihabitans sp. G128]QXC61822.1 hypothetical protein KSP35_03015 [Aquihabitans sp. G128]
MSDDDQPTTGAPAPEAEPDPAAEVVEPALADTEVRDALPDDLDISEFVGPYVFPNNNRRRVPGYLYLFIGVACLLAWVLLGRDGDAVLVNGGFLAAGIGLVLIGGFHLVAGWNLDVDERDALVAATERVGFPVGHASAQLGWRGLRSRPTWRILLYSAENPPTRRGLVLVDGVDGEIVSWFTEDNPEDWSDLDGELARAGATGGTSEAAAGVEPGADG